MTIITRDTPVQRLIKDTYEKSKTYDLPPVPRYVSQRLADEAIARQVTTADPSGITVATLEVCDGLIERCVDMYRALYISYLTVRAAEITSLRRQYEVEALPLDSAEIEAWVLGQGTRTLWQHGICDLVQLTNYTRKQMIELECVGEAFCSKLEKVMKTYGLKYAD